MIAECYRLGGAIGVDPGPLTIRELVLMAEGAGRTMWQHTSSILAMLFNGFFDTKKSGIKKPSHFNPFEQPAGTAVADKRVPVEILRRSPLFKKVHKSKGKRKKVQ